VLLIFIGSEWEIIVRVLRCIYGCGIFVVAQIQLLLGIFLLSQRERLSLSNRLPLRYSIVKRYECGCKVS
jgi:hypothetical protein